MEYYLRLQKKKRNPVTCNMDKPRGHYAQWNKSEKDKYYMVSLIYGIKSLIHRNKE